MPKFVYRPFVIAVTCIGLSLSAFSCSSDTPSNPAPIKLPSDTRLASLYQESCKGCHTRASSGAPQAHKPGHWKVRLNKGMDRLLDNTKHGYRAMPPGGLCRNCSDDDFQQLIEFMAAE